MPAAVKSKNQWRRAQQKAKKAGVCPTADETLTGQTKTVDTALEETKVKTLNQTDSTTTTDDRTSKVTTDESYDFDSEPAAEDLAAIIHTDNPLFDQFKAVFSKFAEPVEAKTDKPEVYYDNDDLIPDDDQAGDGSGPDGEGNPDGLDGRLSRKKRKEFNKLSIAQLKASVRRPELVEWTDVSSSDPSLLLAVKSHRNVVPVPTHWSLKREYLSSKRGIEKAPFRLPQFIQDTGITEMRDAVLEKQAEQTLKQKQRERVQPKMGRLDIDYQKLYEAFFRFQTKPDLTRYGEVYYEGKEFETNLKHLRPGELSDDLKEALNIPPGAPPPWLINQQRFGPPPSYPALKIAGLNAPPPAGAQWGFHPGGYGKPPVDEFNRPLYGGDIFGVLQPQQPHHETEPVERTLWGEIEEPEPDSEAEESSDDDDEDEEMSDGDGVEGRAGKGRDEPVESEITEYGSAGPADFSLRKQREAAAAAAAASGPDDVRDEDVGRTAYQIIPEKQVRGGGFFGSDRAYDLRAAAGPVLGQDSDRSTGRKRKGIAGGDVEVSVDPEALERDDRLSKSEVKKQYEDARKTEQSQSGWDMHEDLSNMIAEESQKRLRRDEERRTGKK